MQQRPSEQSKGSFVQGRRIAQPRFLCVVHALLPVVESRSRRGNSEEEAATMPLCSTSLLCCSARLCGSADERHALEWRRRHALTHSTPPRLACADSLFHSTCHTNPTLGAAAASLSVSALLCSTVSLPRAPLPPLSPSCRRDVVSSRSFDPACLLRSPRAVPAPVCSVQACFLRGAVAGHRRRVCCCRLRTRQADLAESHDGPNHAAAHAHDESSNGRKLRDRLSARQPAPHSQPRRRPSRLSIPQAGWTASALSRTATTGRRSNAQQHGGRLWLPARRAAVSRLPAAAAAGQRARRRAAVGPICRV